MDESGNHKQAEQRERIRWIVSILIPLLCALLSFCVIAKYTSSPTMKINAHAIQSLDDKKTTTLELTAAATAASAAITLIPGDAGTPIADKLADLSSYFLIVVCAIYLEKYLVTITGLAAFKLLIPIGCILLSLCFGFKKDLGRTIACKLVLFGLAVYLVVPVSVRVADLIDATYGASMENTIASAKQATDEIKGEADTQSQESSGSDTGGKSSFWSGLVDKVEDTVTGAKVNLENTLNRFIEAIAVMLVTSCVIPILVLLFFCLACETGTWGKYYVATDRKKEERGKKNMKLLMKQRVFSWTDTYDVYDEAGNKKYFVKAELFRLGHQIHVFDVSGNEIGMIKQRLFTLLPSFDIVIGGREFGNIQKEFTFFKPRYEIDYNGWRCEGDFLAWDYDVYAGCSSVVHISKELFHWGDTYTINILNPEDEIPALMLVIAIDAANCTQGK